jgi:hypothetical protein
MIASLLATTPAIDMFDFQGFFARQTLPRHLEGNFIRVTPRNPTVVRVGSKM